MLKMSIQHPVLGFEYEFPLVTTKPGLRPTVNKNFPFW